MVQEYVIGIDLGGTKILTALADLKGNIIAKDRRATEAKKGKDVIINNIKATIDQVLADGNVDLTVVKVIALGSPGPLDIKRGMILNPPNLALENVDIVEEFKDLGVPVFLENDANAAALGEKWFGRGKGVDNLVYITVSTGIGGGVIINKEIVHGVNSGAGELGHMTLYPNSTIKCGCGNYGCFEALASGTALTKLGKDAFSSKDDSLIKDMAETVDEVDGAIIAQAALQGDQVAKDIFAQVGQYLGIGLANIINIFNPEQIIIGGGVSNSWDLLDAKVAEVVQERALDSLVADCEILLSELGNDIGVKGAVAVALSNLGEL